MDHRTVKAILFDLENTLIETARAGAVAMQKVSDLLRTTPGVDCDMVVPICDKFKQKLLHERFEPSAGKTIDEVRMVHWEESIQEALGTCRGPSLPAQCYQLWKNTRLDLLSMSEEVCTMLVELRRTHKLALLTNGETQTQREKVEATGCSRFFDAVVVGGEHAEQKPSRSIFTFCSNALGVQAADCVMVGDSLDTDIEGGFNAGVRATVWINNTGEALPDGAVQPDYTVSSVLELPRVLAELK